MIRIDNEKCVVCGRCIEVCPALVIEKENEEVRFVHAGSCIECYHCVAICPEEAVTCTEFPLEEFKKITKTKAASPAALERLLERRRSIREFKNKAVPWDLLEELATVASNAPTGHNDQGTEFTIVTSKKRIDSIDERIFKTFESISGVLDTRIAKNLVKTIAGKSAAKEIDAAVSTFDRFKEADPEKRKLIFRNAPVLVVAHAAPGVTSGKDDCVIALDQMMLAANARGLGSTWIGMVVGAAKIDPWIKRQLKVPIKNTIHAAIILGWPKYAYKRTIPRKQIPISWIN